MHDGRSPALLVLYVISSVQTTDAFGKKGSRGGGRFLGQFSVLLFRTIFLSKQVFKRGARGVSSRLTKQIVYLMSTSCLGDLSAAINSLGKPTVRGFEHT